MSEGLASALIADDTQSELVRYLRMVLGTPVECAASLEALRGLLARDPERFFVAVVDLALPGGGEAAVDALLAEGVPVIVLSAGLDEALRDDLMARNVIDYVIRSSAGEVEYVTNLARRVYNNRSIQVLIVDDSRAYRHYLETLLRAHRYQTLQAQGGPQALEIIDGAGTDSLRLVIVDYYMPGMDGLQLIDEIRKRRSRSELAILGISQAGNAKLPARLLRSGANDFVTKPLMVEEFYCRVSQNIDTIEHIRLVEDSATRDYLTRVYNRRYLFDTGTRLYENARRGNLSLAVAMLDADHFKRVNDTYGHHVGDVVLKRIAATLESCLRQADMIARFGGEEFCVLATGLDVDGARQLFERVRQEVASLRIPVDCAQVQVTISIGVTLALEQSLESMIRRADAALYRAKHSGRDRVVID